MIVMTFRIIYTSRASRYLDLAEMKALCDVASNRNRRGGITGLFLYDGVRFLQALEGERSKVSETMGRIATDPRHYDINYLYCDTADHAEFFEWSMQAPFSPGDNAEAFLDRVKDDVRLVEDLDLKAQFIGFAKLATTGKNRV